MIGNNVGRPFVRRAGSHLTPTRAFVLSFALLIGLGAILLMIPGMATIHRLRPIDALFTATSAVCVTGLTVVDTGTAFNLTGQWIILLLVQTGGLGIMTFSLFFFRMMRLDITLRDVFALGQSLTYRPRQDILSLVRLVVLMTLAIEFLGALSLFFFWLPDYSAPKAAYLAVFHSVSAFCNAGFSLWADSLTQYRTHFGINLTFFALIISGGLGFIVLAELGSLRQAASKRLSLHAKVVCWTTLVLLIAGGFLFLGLEWTNILAGLTFPQKIIVSLFQTITPRTAGFNSVDFNHLSNTTLLLTMFLMFIGGSPGSTAGGVKTVTLALLFALARSRYQGFSRVNLFKRTVPDEIVTRSLTITLVAITIIGLALLILLTTEVGSLDHVQTRDVFLRLLFEVISAFSTVGLSMGTTADLTDWGKLTIILTMFLGRIGPLTVALALISRHREGRKYHYGSEDLMLG